MKLKIGEYWENEDKLVPIADPDGVERLYQTALAVDLTWMQLYVGNEAVHALVLPILLSHNYWDELRQVAQPLPNFELNA